MAANPAPNSMYLQNIDEVRKVFQRFDSNGDGKISTEELSGVLEALGSSTSADQVAKMMAEIDTDKDGHINLEEFAAFCKGDADPYNSAEKELREAFELYDQDHDGKISAAELHLILTRLGEHCTVADCAGMISSVDSDGDGFVSFDEFKKMMTTNNAAA
ncbi:calcium-binding allergen Ole e 8-like [Henckelia pumila]|uniref:calcium-binding allergen Ole e 8-like n=1 Tax=Henckelia pumila TaxID=405737 RepID=UPI003C6E0D67